MLKKFVKYVSQNMLGMVGMSVYILADTYFISVAVGTDGITALNLVLPVYNMIFAIGAMMGVGSAIRLVIERNQRRTARKETAIPFSVPPTGRCSYSRRRPDCPAAPSSFPPAPPASGPAGRSGSRRSSSPRPCVPARHRAAAAPPAASGRHRVRCSPWRRRLWRPPHRWSG